MVLYDFEKGLVVSAPRFSYYLRLSVNVRKEHQIELESLERKFLSNSGLLLRPNVIEIAA